MSDISSFCMIKVVPKKEFEFISQDEKTLSFFQDGHPILTIEKSRNYPESYLDVIFHTISTTLEEFMKLLKECKSSNNF